MSALSSSSSSSSSDPVDPFSAPRTTLSFHALCTRPFIPWDYAQACLDAGVTSETLHDAVAAPYLQPNRLGTLRSCCALSGMCGIEVAHVFPADHAEAFEILRTSGAVPDWASVDSTANLLPLSEENHDELRNGHLHLLPDLDQVLARLACEAVCLSTLGASQPSSRPSFDEFYRALEARPALVRLCYKDTSPAYVLMRKEALYGQSTAYRTNIVDPTIEVLAHLPAVPPFALPISVNCLILSFVLRMRRSEPGAASQLETSSDVLSEACSLLHSIWLTPPASHAALAALLARARTLLATHCPSFSPFASFLLHPEAGHTLADVLSTLPPPFPAGTVHALGAEPAQEVVRAAALRRGLARAAGEGAPPLERRVEVWLGGVERGDSVGVEMEELRGRRRETFGAVVETT